MQVKNPRKISRTQTKKRSTCPTTNQHERLAETETIYNNEESFLPSNASIIDTNNSKYDEEVSIASNWTLKVNN